MLVLVVPNVMGMCFWSPPLDEFGNSVRGVQFCEEFVKLYTFQKVLGSVDKVPIASFYPVTMGLKKNS